MDIIKFLGFGIGMLLGLLILRVAEMLLNS